MNNDLNEKRRRRRKIRISETEAASNIKKKYIILSV
jgi:hypothetical protein